MGLIDSAISGAMEAVGSGMMDAGNFFLKGGYSVWGNFSKVAMWYVQQQPESLGAWQVVTGSVYTLSTGIAASLSVLFFVLGWMRNSVEIRNNFSIDEVFKFCIRYVLTAGLIVNALSLISSVSECATAVVAVIYEEEGLENQEAPDDLFERAKDSLEDGDSGADWLSVGVVAFLGGAVGGLFIIVCSVQLVLSVLSRLFKMYLCIPFAPVAFAGFAGGHEMARSGIAWIQTFLSYALEAVVIVLAITVSYGLFSGGGLFEAGDGTWNAATMILQICGYCMPFACAAASVKGAELVVRRCLGLG